MVKSKAFIQWAFLVLLPQVLFVSCSTREDFDSNKWKSTTGERLMCGIRDTNPRALMVQNLLDSKLLIGQDYDKVQDLLGKERIGEDSTVRYLVIEKYQWNIDPEYVTFLVVQFDSNMRAIDAFLE